MCNNYFLVITLLSVFMCACFTELELTRWPSSLSSTSISQFSAHYCIRTNTELSISCTWNVYNDTVGDYVTVWTECCATVPSDLGITYNTTYNVCASTFNESVCSPTIYVEEVPNPSNYAVKTIGKKHLVV